MHILQQCEPSRFLFELPEEDLDGAKHVVSKLFDTENEPQALNTFADLKALLGATE